MERPLRVLQINRDMKKGGVQAEIMYPARILDSKRVHFDVMLLSDTKGFYEEEFAQYGNIYRLPLKKRKTKIGRALAIIVDYFAIRKGMIRFLQSHEAYDAVHGHELFTNAACMSAAKKCGVPVRIAYCAVNKPGKNCDNRFFVKVYLRICALVLNRCCTHKFGVTQNAADYLFGKGKGVPIKNPTVDFQKFDPAKYSLTDDGNIHLLMVGSYSSRKNQKFGLKVFRELHKLQPGATMTFIGYPRSDTETYFPELQSMVKEYHLEDNVVFLPQDADIPREMAKATFLLIPSLQEGLPNVALEAQKMGLPCFLSTDVSDDCDCGLCTYVPLEEGPENWAEKLVEYVAAHGFEKRFVDMSEWDNRKVCEMYMEIWGNHVDR